MINTSQPHTTFEVKSNDISVLSLKLKNNNINFLEKELLENFGPESENKNFFNNDNIVIDLTEKDIEINDFKLIKIKDILKLCKLNPIAIRSNDQNLITYARSIGLDEASPDTHKNKKINTEATQVQVVQEVVREVAVQAMVIDRPLRSGQKIYARGCDLVVLAMVNQGAEVISDGNIHVYAPLRGKAMAGARGNTEARIFTMCLEAELISIAGVYRTSEIPLPDEVKGKPTQIRLSNDGQEKMIIESLKL
jgi:septum site-determining protein MinC